MWVFGYGSLLWKVNFPYEQKVLGFIKGFMRRFWHGSVDHRGIPGAPGRVPTLLSSNDPEERVYGVAYKISDEDIPAAKEKLGIREGPGYDEKRTVFYPLEETMQPVEMIIYIGNDENYLGPASLEEMAQQISKCVGPSGRNDEYLFLLAKAMRELLPHVEDPHLFELEAAVKQIKSQDRS